MPLGRATATSLDPSRALDRRRNFAATLSDAAGDEEIAFLLAEAARQLRAMGSDSMIKLARTAATERQEPPCGR